jgi:hypothetical protein
MASKLPATNCLQIISDEGIDKRLANGNNAKSTSNKPRSATGVRMARKGPPVHRTNSASSSRTSTPTKQISLQSVKRKEDRCSELFSNETEKVTVSASQLVRKCTASSPDLGSSPSSTVKSSSGCDAAMEILREKNIEPAARDKGGDGTNDDRLSESDSDSDESDTSSTDDEPIKAPSELLMEFLECVMKCDYINAQKLCKMILIYEPDNPEALNFKPLIEQKLALGETSSSDDEDDEDDDDDENSQSEDESDSDDDNESSSDEERTNISTGDTRHSKNSNSN